MRCGYSTTLSLAQVSPIRSKHQYVPVNLRLMTDFLKFRLCLSWGMYGTGYLVRILFSYLWPEMY